MFLIGAIIAIAATFGAVALMFNSFNFISRKVHEENFIGATVNYMDILNRKLSFHIANGDLREEELFGASYNFNTVTCERIENILQSKRKSLGLGCTDPLGRTWWLRRYTLNNSPAYFIEFSAVPEETLRRLGYNGNVPQVQKSIALRISSALKKGGYLEGNGLVHLPGDPNLKNLADISAPVSKKCPVNRLPQCPNGSYFNAFYGYCESGQSYMELINQGRRVVFCDTSCYFVPTCLVGRYNPVVKCCI